MKKPLVFLVLPVFVLSLGIAGCVNKPEGPESSSVKRKAVSAMRVENAEEFADTAAPEPSPAIKMAEKKVEQKIQRKIIYSSYLKLKVKDVVKSIDEIKLITTKNKGYIGSSSVTKDENENKSGKIIVRIPPEKLDETVLLIKKIGDVSEDSLSGEDITKDYYDLQSRLVNSQKFEGRLLKLLGTKTTKVSDMLEVERELARIRAEIESFQGQIRYYNNLVGMATITVDLYEEGVTLPARGNILQPIIDTFSEAFGSFFASVGSIIILLFAVAPWIIFGSVVIYILAWIWRRVRGTPKE